MGYKVDSLNVELTVSAKSAANSLNSLSKSLEKIKNQTDSLGTLKKLRGELTAFSKVNLTPIADALKTISSVSTITEKRLKNMFGELQKGADRSNKPFTDDIFTEYASDIDDVTEEIVELNIAESDTAKSTEELKKETKGASTATKLLKNELEKQTKETEKADKSVKRLHSSHSRFMKYAAYRGIRAAFNAITQSFTEGLKEAYLWSNEAANGYSIIANTMDDIQSEITQMRRQIGAGVGEFLTLIKPVINFLFDAINAVFDKVTQFFAALSGQDTYMRAKRIETSWEAVEDKTKGATQAVKDYKKQLLGIDELNVLGKDEAKAATGEELAIPADAYELAPIERVFATNLAINLKDVLFNWDNLDSRSIGLKICAGLGAATGGFIGFTYAGVGGAIVGTIAGLALGVTVGSILFDTTKAKYTPETAKMDIINTVFGGTAGAAIGFAVGGPLGAAIGLTVGSVISLAVNALNTTYEEKIFEEYQNTGFWTEYRKFMDETLPKALEKEKSLRLKIDSIDLNLTDAQVVNLELAKKLINDIFTLDEKDIKTPEEIENLKTKINELNGLSIEGVHLEYMEELGKVTGGTREELDKLIESLLHEARVEAGMAKYGELQKAIVETELELIEQNKILQDNLDNQHEAYLMLTGAQADYVQAEREIASATNEAQRMFGLYNPALVLGEENLAKLQKRQDDARHAVDLYTLAMNDANEMVEEQSKVIELLNEDKDKAAEKSEILMGLINDEKTTWNKDTKAVNKNAEAMGIVVDESGELIEATSILSGEINGVSDAEKTARKNAEKYAKAMQNSNSASADFVNSMSSVKSAVNGVNSSILEVIKSLGSLDEAGKTKRTIEVEFEGGTSFKMENATDAAIFGARKGMGYANGGFVEGGHLFFANENGNPEYIGNINGRTAVANTDQMSEAIEQAAYLGMSRALQQYGNNNSTSNWQPMTSEEMYLMLKKKAGSTSLRTGMAY